MQELLNQISKMAYEGLLEDKYVYHDVGDGLLTLGMLTLSGPVWGGGGGKGLLICRQDIEVNELFKVCWCIILIRQIE